MRPSRCTCLVLLVFALAFMAAPATATTLIRQGVKQLARENAVVLTARVVDLYTHWNEDHSFIVTDVTLRPSQVYKGAQSSRDVRITLLGGTIGDITTLVIGGPELVPGSEYLFFLNDEELPGGRVHTTVRDLVQGVFQIERTKGRALARSLAIGHPLLADADGRTEPAGGVNGLDLEALEAEVRASITE
ncbi:MAG: hypothetical protein HZA61_17180 [Candidatus Eisenbacteria bacterium]|uniref:CHRD domain-containing protein n=1 Tax=Eiseniibacteriota bacterium TaxID=2212470 RepID=A0A933W4N1_UNCEI|nr:hypothetical protein [Candidatus Eisenbacteria bacterium]